MHYIRNGSPSPKLLHVAKNKNLFPLCVLSRMVCISLPSETKALAGPYAAAENEGTPCLNLAEILPTSLEPSSERGASVACGSSSLLSICTGFLTTHLKEVLGLGAEVLPLLPPPTKAALIIAARQAGLLSESVLAQLVDEGHVRLTLRGCSSLDPASLCAALQKAARLQALDLGGCHLAASVLKTLGASCPLLEELRLGSGEVSEAGLRALKAVMPVLEAGSEPASDSWEGLEGAATMRPGRLMSLRALHWAAMPAAILVWMQRTCPKVSLVRDAALEERPEPSLSVWELEDTRWLPPNCVQSMERARSAPPPEEVVVHIAEKFRLAWESRETRLREIAEKQSKNEARRKMRMISAAERAIYTWEDSL
uniref:Uncharacterized protein n=1 Tax=Auxenochlorella protothecoides TaxID=3075 RepID=A0A1D1ZW33_AUXPR